MNAKTLAIIPARGGSKRIPRKNIRDFCGQPIIKYSIDAANRTKIFDEVMVSTDDPEISEIARTSGAQVPFLRTPETANDHATLAEVFREVVLQYKTIGQEFKYFCCVFATAPFVSPKRLTEGYELLLSTGADSVLPVTRFSYPIQRASKITNDGCLEMFWPENYNLRSQDLEASYHDCGQFCWMKVSSLLEQMKAYADHTVPLVLPESEVQDIDSEEDWAIAEFKYKFLNLSKATQT